jgi:hypothetical protein
MTAQLAKLSRNHDLAKAINYMLRRWDAFTCIPRQRPWQRIEVVSQGAFGLCRSDRGTKMKPKSPKSKLPAEQVVKDIRRKTRRHFYCLLMTRCCGSGCNAD